MTTHLRNLPDGTRFLLLRTGQKFTLLMRIWEMGKTRYLVQDENASRAASTLHHSCHVKPVVRAILSGEKA